MYIQRSPNREIRTPAPGANTIRVSANTVTIADAAATPTSKLAAYWGRIGAMMPKPRAITNAATTRTQISRGTGTRAGAWLMRP